MSAPVQVAVCISGVYDLLMEEQGRYPNDADDPAIVRFLGGSARQRPELAGQASPINYLSKDDPPLLMFHGEMDRRIDVEQARQFALALKALGRKDKVVLLPDGGHGLEGPYLDSKHRDRIERFFARHLRPDE